MCMAIIFCRKGISFQCWLLFSKLLFETVSLMFSKLIFVWASVRLSKGFVTLASYPQSKWSKFLFFSVLYFQTKSLYPESHKSRPTNIYVALGGAFASSMLIKYEDTHVSEDVELQTLSTILHWRIWVCRIVEL